MAGDAEVIVLDDSSDEDVGPAAAGAAAEAPDVEEVPVQAMEIDDRDLDSDEEIAIVGQTGFVRPAGPVLSRALSSPRFGCAYGDAVEQQEGRATRVCLVNLMCTHGAYQFLCRVLVWRPP